MERSFFVLFRDSSERVWYADVLNLFPLGSVTVSPETAVANAQKLPRQYRHETTLPCRPESD
jgi:hypothetical protein